MHERPYAPLALTVAAGIAAVVGTFAVVVLQGDAGWNDVDQEAFALFATFALGLTVLWRVLVFWEEGVGARSIAICGWLTILCTVVFACFRVVDGAAATVALCVLGLAGGAMVVGGRQLARVSAPPADAAPTGDEASADIPLDPRWRVVAAAGTLVALAGVVLLYVALNSALFEEPALSLTLTSLRDASTIADGLWYAAVGAVPTWIWAAVTARKAVALPLLGGGIALAAMRIPGDEGLDGSGELTSVPAWVLVSGLLILLGGLARLYALARHTVATGDERIEF